MESLKLECLNRGRCMQTMMYCMFANIGGRDMQKPTCEYCNMYTPKEREE